MKLNNLKIKSIFASNIISDFHRKYTYQIDNSNYTPNVNYAYHTNKILMTKYDGTSLSGLSYFSILNSVDGMPNVNYISSEAIKIFSNSKTSDDTGFYLVGTDTPSGTSKLNSLITKIDNNGNELWKYSYKASSSTNSFLQAIDLDSNGDIIAAGTATGNVDNTQLHPFFIKFNTSGATQLAKIIEFQDGFSLPISHRVSSIKIDQSNNYVYFISQEFANTKNLVFGCLDNNFNVVWLKSLVTSGTERIRQDNALTTVASKSSIDFNGSSVFVTFTTNDTLVGGLPYKPIIIEFNKSNGNIIKSQYINARHDYTYLKFENGLMKFFGSVFVSSLGNYGFVSTINNWSSTPSYSGYYYDHSILFSNTSSNVIDINNNYIYGVAGYPTLIKSYNYNYTTATSITNNFSNITLSLSNVTNTVSTVTSSYNTPITPTYAWNTTNINIS